MEASAGCLSTTAGRYRPVVVVAHGSIYISHETFERSAQAVQFARDAINETAYSAWHNHTINTDE